VILRNTPHRWGAVSQLLHWLIVALIAIQAILGLTGLLLPLGVEKLAVLARHKSVGITILGLATLRLLWRWLNPISPLPSLKPHERLAAHFTHAALYLLLFAMPLTGWIMSSARGFAVSWFNLFELPDLAPKSEPLYHAMIRTHAVLAASLGVIVALHIAAALRHHFLLKDDTLRRMLPFGRITLSALAAVLIALPPARAAARATACLPRRARSLARSSRPAPATKAGSNPLPSVSIRPAAGSMSRSR
jgi:cytochrome b561